MAIKDLEARQGNVDLVLEIVEKAEPREFEKFGNTGKVCNCKGKDETGTITMTLWNEDIDKVSVGNKVHITNGWVSEWQGELQLSTGKFGKLEVVGSDSAETVDEAAVEKPINEAVEEELIDNPPQSDAGSKILTEDEKVEEELIEELGAEEETIEDSATEDEKSSS